MKKFALATVIPILILSVVIPANASITTKVKVNDNLFITYDFENLDPILYDQTKANTQFDVSTIPNIIMQNFEKRNQTMLNWSLDPQTDIYDDVNRAIHISFFMGGSDIMSFIVNKTTMKRTHQLSTEWRRFQVNLTSDFTLDFTQHLAKPVAEWQKINATTFYYENRQTGTLDIFFYLILPSSASNIQVQGDTIFFDMPFSLEDQLLNSPFLPLAALAVALVIILIYKKAR